MSSTELNVEAYKKIVFKQKSLLTTIKFVLKIMRLLPVLRQTVMRECSVKEVCAWCGERVGETRGGGQGVECMEWVCTLYVIKRKSLLSNV